MKSKQRCVVGIIYLTVVALLGLTPPALAQDKPTDESTLDLASFGVTVVKPEGWIRASDPDTATICIMVHGTQANSTIMRFEIQPHTEATLQEFADHIGGRTGMKATARKAKLDGADAIELVADPSVKATTTSHPDAGLVAEHAGYYYGLYAFGKPAEPKALDTIASGVKWVALAPPSDHFNFGHQMIIFHALGIACDLPDPYRPVPGHKGGMIYATYNFEGKGTEAQMLVVSLPKSAQADTVDPDTCAKIATKMGTEQELQWTEVVGPPGRPVRVRMSQIVTRKPDANGPMGPVQMVLLTTPRTASALLIFQYPTDLAQKYAAISQKMAQSIRTDQAYRSGQKAAGN